MTSTTTYNQDSRRPIKKTNDLVKSHSTRCVIYRKDLLMELSTILLLSCTLVFLYNDRCSGQRPLFTQSDKLDHLQTVEFKLNANYTSSSIAGNSTHRNQQVLPMSDKATISPANTVNTNIETSILQYTVTISPPDNNETQTLSDIIHPSPESNNNECTSHRNCQDSSSDYEYDETEEGNLDYELNYTASSIKLLKEKKCTPEDLYEFAWQIDEDYWSKLSNEHISYIRRRLNAYKKARDDYCTPELVYGFLKLDSQVNTTLLLDMKELADGLHVHNYKHCRKLFLHQCDRDQDGLLTDREWCSCFNEQTRLCHKAVKAQKRKLLKTLTSHGKLLTRSDAKTLIQSTYKPICLFDGSFNTRQCDNQGICWCVDRRGIEYRGTRRNTRMGPLNNIDCSNYSDPARDELIHFTILNDHTSRSKLYGHTGEAPIDPMLPIRSTIEGLPDNIDNYADSELPKDKEHHMSNDISRNP